MQTDTITSWPPTTPALYELAQRGIEAQRYRQAQRKAGFVRMLGAAVPTAASFMAGYLSAYSSPPDRSSITAVLLVVSAASIASLMAGVNWKEEHRGALNGSQSARPTGDMRRPEAYLL